MRLVGALWLDTNISDDAYAGQRHLFLISFAQGFGVEQWRPGRRVLDSSSAPSRGIRTSVPWLRAFVCVAAAARLYIAVYITYITKRRVFPSGFRRRWKYFTLLYDCFSICFPTLSTPPLLDIDSEVSHYPILPVCHVQFLGPPSSSVLYDNLFVTLQCNSGGS